MIKVKKFLFRTRVTVSESFRALVLINGKFHDILRPGRHSINSLNKDVIVESHALAKPEFTSAHEQALRASRPDLVAGHFTSVRTSDREVAVVLRDGKLFGILKSDGRTTFW